MALKVLIADPNDKWLASAKTFLEQREYLVDVAMTGKQAQLNVFNSRDESNKDKKNYFAVILNLEIQNHPGPQVMKFIKTRYPGQKIIVTLESDEGLKSGKVSESALRKLGADDFLAKPFEMEELLATIEGNQSIKQLLQHLPKREGESDEVQVQLDDQVFTKIAIGEFVSDKSILFDVYIRLQENKYLKILHAGDSFNKERIDRYRDEKKVTHLYFHARDRKKYIKFCNHLAAKFMSMDSEGATKIKVNILRNSSEKFLEEVHTEGLKPQILDAGKKICDNMAEMIGKDKSLFKLIRELQELDPTAFSHAYMVSLYASMTTFQFEWQSKAIIETVTMASLLHDLGKIQLPPELVLMSEDEMNEEQKELYRGHPEIGATLLDGNTMVPNSVKQIVSQHHELSDGSGFPNGLKDPKILTLAKIVILSNHFTHYIIDNDLSPIVGVKKLLANPEMAKKFNGSVLEKFIKSFIDPGQSKVSKKAS